MDARSKININRVLVITVGYVFINNFIAVLIHVVLNSDYSLGTTAEYSFINYLLLSSMVGVIAGTLGGSALVMLNNSVFRRRSFGLSIGLTAILYSLVFALANTINAGVVANLMSTPNQQISFIGELQSSLFNPLTLMIFSMWGVITLFSLFLIQVSDKFGPGVLWKFIRGDYFQPKEEERIFMFLDLRSSTTIAEKISNAKYFSLLKDLFSDITNIILEQEGEIYQYVGDEVVISWTMEKGITNSNCLHCFFRIEQILASRASYYLSEYLVEPEMKAGIHSGKVIAGEVGVIKRDIVFSGDVLNTTARIQGQCNAYGVNLIISQETAEKLDLSEFNIIRLGEITLKGKKEKTELIAIEPIK